MIISNKDCIAADVTAKMKLINAIIWMCFLSTKNIQCLVNLKYYVVCCFNTIFDILSQQYHFYPI